MMNMNMNFNAIKPNDNHFNNGNENVLINNLNNNSPLRNNYFDSSNKNQKIIQNKRQKPQNNNNINFYGDKRLYLCLNYLGLKKYIINFQRNGIKFENFLSLTNKDFAAIKIPNNVINIIQQFIISYLKFGSLYTIQEIQNYFYIKWQKQKK